MHMSTGPHGEQKLSCDPQELSSWVTMSCLTCVLGIYHLPSAREAGVINH